MNAILKKVSSLLGSKYMNAILKKVSSLLGSNRVQSSHNSLPNSRNSQHSLLHDGSETATRGQLVQVLLRDLVRKAGIPPNWVQCQIQVVNSRSRGQRIYVRLVVKHWDERLMKYAFAFQKALLTEIVQFEPQAASWLQGISWQLEVADNCPLTELPGPGFWQAPATSVQRVDPYDIIPLPADALTVALDGPKVPTLPELSVAATLAATPLLNAPETLPSLSEELMHPPDETAQDLERLFAIRDTELENMAANNLLPTGYDNTEPAPLQNR